MGHKRGMDTTRRKYADQLIERSLVDEAMVQKMMDEYRARLDRGEQVADVDDEPRSNQFAANWNQYDHIDKPWDMDTSVPLKRIRALAKKLLELPEGFKLHNRVKRIMSDRAKMASGELPLDWGFAETMAYATLVEEGTKLRLVGQDSGRGTFFHRHAVLHNQADASTFTPLQTIDPELEVSVIDSLLSEEAVLGFEYGYATAAPLTLTIWEAQFGDFANGAQVVIDQFISSGEAKWGRLCGLALFLPHGYEGQGPEHSSARLERFLQLCAEHNMQVCVPSTPGQMFHMIRRQMLRRYRKPLVVMTPKSLLRHKRSVSPLSMLSEGHFQLIIPETEVLDNDKVTRVVFCSGKVYYDLFEAREVHGLSNVALIRIEQLYPFPIEQYAEAIALYPHARQIVWCQEEPQNQGAWYQIRHRLQEPLEEDRTLYYAGRSGAAAPASGLFKVHNQQQQALVEAALDFKVAASESKRPPKKPRKSE